MKRLICFGDSITAKEVSDDGTERLTPRLRYGLGSWGWEVINAGISGNNSRDALLRVERDIVSQSPDLVTVLFGANDAATHKMIKLEEYKTNLLTIVQKITPEKTVLISPSPVDESRPKNRTNDVIKEYSNVVNQVAIETGSQFIDLFSEMIIYPDYSKMLRDGLHYTESGYKFLSQLILIKIIDNYKISVCSI